MLFGKLRRDLFYRFLLGEADADNQIKILLCEGPKQRFERIVVTGFDVLEDNPLLLLRLHRSLIARCIEKLIVLAATIEDQTDLEIRKSRRQYKRERHH